MTIGNVARSLVFGWTGGLGMFSFVACGFFQVAMWLFSSCQKLARSCTEEGWKLKRTFTYTHMYIYMYRHI